ncbi:MAG: aldo/keto reductase [Verrucomicrobiota bacterium]|jgi:aryl-alcohol dehydrogenase-like predicted oxidoreductase
MNYRILGKTGFRVSEIGFGAWGLGGDAYGRVDDAVSKTALLHALDLGVNFFDTADLYGGGHSEKIVGETLRPFRDRVLIATKVGTLPHTGFYMPQDFSPGHIRKGIEASLRRLQTGHIDLYQLHSPDLQTCDLEGAVRTLEHLRAEGVVRAFGISVRSPADGKLALQRFAVDTLQVNFNLIDQRAVDCGLFELAQRLHVGIIARTPLCFGYLTGKFTGSENFEGRDHRANWPAEQLRRWAEAPNAFASLHDHRRTPAQLALRFCLAWNAVSTVIPGMMTPQHVAENLSAVRVPRLTEAELAEIRRIYQAHTFYDPAVKQKALAAETPSHEPAHV